MRALLVVLAFGLSSACFAADDGWSWANAISKHQSNGREIVFRYVRTFPRSFARATQPTRVILLWRYESNSGMPTMTERERMDRLEDLLKPALEASGFATLALVSTGESAREWVYYVQSEAEFFSKLNAAIGREPRFPIEIHVAEDAKWSTYEKFRAGVKE